MTILKQWPDLKKVNSRGKAQIWKIWVEQDGKVHIGVQYGQEDGEMQTTYTEIKEGKNKGKSNETSKVEQAILEAESKWKKQQDKGYGLEAKVEAKQFLPMLAKSFSKDGDKMEFPCLAQPKLDGTRILAHFKDGKVVLTSRKGKEYTVTPHINDALQKTLEQHPLICIDGEGYIHGVGFDEVIGMVKRDEAKKGSETFQYHVYDLFVMDHPEFTFEQRHNLLQIIVAAVNSQHIILVETFAVESADDVMQTHKIFEDKGYEGIMLRNKKSLYQQDKRSDGLLKVKTFLDEEFKCIGANCGKGRFEDFAVFTLKTKDGKEFRAMPMGEESVRKEYLTNKDKYIGLEATIRYFELSKDGIPRFPILVSFRDYE